MNYGLIAFLANLASTWFMTGLIWFVQIVHYPQFDGVGADAFVAYHHRHTRMTTFVVGPPMLIEMLSSLALLWVGHTLMPAWAAWTGLALLAMVWFSTAFLQVPRHDRLAGGWDEKAGRFLCTSNWIRTFAWSARGALLLWAAARALGK
jgi:hypothetical protein